MCRPIRPMRIRTTLEGLLVASLLVAAAACDASKPEFVGDDDPIIITATLDAETVSNRHRFALTKSGTVELRVTALAVTDPGSGDPVEQPAVIVSLGRPLEELCSVTLTEFLPQDAFFTVFLETTLYCLDVTRSAALAVAFS